ncbi:hypothetical protein V7794_09085 [Rhizobium laguerreae]
MAIFLSSKGIGIPLCSPADDLAATGTNKRPAFDDACAAQEDVINRPAVRLP